MPVHQAPNDLHLAVALGTATLHEAGASHGVLPWGIRHLAGRGRFAGYALTVQCPPLDNLWIHRALDLIKPNDVLVIGTSGVYGAGYLGEIMCSAALQRAARGIVIDGCVRDQAALDGIGLPVFGRGLCIRGTAKDPAGAGAMNTTIEIGDVSIAPGDLVVGDEDGVVAVPYAQVEDVLARAVARTTAETAILERVRNGESTTQIYRLPVAGVS